MSKVTLIEQADNAAIAAWLGAYLKQALARAEGEIAITVPGGATPFPILAALEGEGIRSRIISTEGIAWAWIGVGVS